MSLNSCNIIYIKPANIGVQWDSVDDKIALHVNFKKMCLVLKEPLRKSHFSPFHQEIQGLLQNKST